jgi:hypothetical protein
MATTPIRPSHKGRTHSDGRYHVAATMRSDEG